MKLNRLISVPAVRTGILTALAFIVCAFSAAAETLHDPALLIGAEPREAYRIWGVPEAVFPGRGEKAEWDYSVFYREGSYLYWIENKVWQVRFDNEYKGEWKGLHIGVLYPVVDSILGKPWIIEDNYRVYIISGYDYPIQVRCYFTDNALSDLYIYRSNV